MPWPRLILLALPLALASCGDALRCGEGTAREGDTCVPALDAGGDAGEALDGALDGGPADAGADAGPCGGACPAETPLCDEAAGRCVACLTHLDCSDPSAARCEDGACVGCEAASDCEHLAGAPVCDDRTCVECTVDAEAERCGDRSCDPAARACTETPRGSVGVCGACLADSECTDGLACAPTELMGTDTGARCLPVRGGPVCTRPFAAARDGTTTLSGAVFDLCGLRTTSCDAYLGFSTEAGTCTGLAEPPSAHDAACGAPGLDDALCRRGAVGNLCTYPCLSDLDCRAPFTCDVASLTPYCTL